jgi:hypothetical protein
MTLDRALASPNTHHLETMTGQFGLFEHAVLDRPRRSLGYTTDDNARALVILSHIRPDHPGMWRYLKFVLAGRVPAGWHNRMSPFGVWVDARGSDDAHGRAIWGLGSALATEDPSRVFSILSRGLDLDSPHPRSNAYAVLGAVAALDTWPAAPKIEAFLRRTARRLPRPQRGVWKWPEPRLTYDNARIPEALMAAGATLGDENMVADGLVLLEWLIETESGERGFSFTPVGGRGPEEMGPAYDQQPIEAWAMADACLRAISVDGGSRWGLGLSDAAAWFLGRNDTGAVLYDTSTGAGYDGLEATGVNLNRGAESTLAALGALHAGHKVVRAPVG